MNAVAAQAARPRQVVDRRGATLRAIYMIWWRDILRFWRDRVRAAMGLVQPLLFLVIFGTGLGSALRGVTGGFGGDYQKFLLPGIMALAILFSSIFSAMSIIWDREFGFLKEVLVAPIDRSAVAIGKTLGGATQATIQGIVLLVLAPFVGIRLTPLAVLELIGLLCCLSFALTALGVAVAARMRSMQGFQMVINFLVQPMFFLSGALFPLVNLPGWLTVLTRLDPAAYGVDPVRRVVLESSGVPQAAIDRLSLTLFGQQVPIVADVAILLAFGFIMLAVAVLFFRQQD